ncbi:MAG: META domain-containing protein [Synergistaceae bacterium]|jgi:membrane-bound inhibitor of C-type lysozyme|nr:META domain-containing protein [Synergistaceae bacterium]
MSKKIFLSVCGVFFTAFLGLLFVGAAVAGEATSELFVMRGGETYILNKVSGSPAERYESSDGAAVFTSEGDEASLEIGGEKISRYVLIRDTGVDDNIILTADGMNFPMKNVEAASGAKYEADGDPETVFWSKGASATLEIYGRSYDDYMVWLPSGGIWLAGEELPDGVEWRVKSIGEVPVIDGSNMTLTFYKGGNIDGFASVNSYRASWLASGGKISIYKPISTKKMGRKPLMDQETEYFNALSEVTMFRPIKEGLELITRDGKSIMLTR